MSLRAGFLTAVVLLMLPALVSARTLWVDLAPQIQPWWATGSLPVFGWDCAIFNPYNGTQTITVTAYAAGNFGPNVKNTSTAVLNTTNTSLTQFQSYVFHWASIHNANGGTLVPKGFQIDVAEPLGFLVGSCIMERYHTEGATSPVEGTSIVINGGMPF